MTVPQTWSSAAIGRTAHQLGLAALLGGNLFGRLAMHPAPETPPAAARLKRVLGVIGALNLASDVALLVIDELSAPQPSRRRLR